MTTPFRIARAATQAARQASAQGGCAATARHYARAYMRGGMDHNTAVAKAVAIATSNSLAIDLADMVDTGRSSMATGDALERDYAASDRDRTGDP